MASLAERISLFLPFSRSLRFPGYAQDVVLNVDGHILLFHAREIECRGYGIRFFVVMDIHPACTVCDGGQAANSGTEEEKKRLLLRVEGIQALARTISSVAEHVVNQTFRGIEIEQVMRE